MVIINDGRLITRSLYSRGHNEEWLEKQLRQHHVKGTQDVFLLTVDEENRVYLSKKEVEK